LGVGGGGGPPPDGPREAEGTSAGLIVARDLT
jgi:hypothetical protein